MPLEDRDYIRGQHPPTCSCVNCTNRRLKGLKKEPKYPTRRPTPISPSSTEPPKRVATPYRPQGWLIVVLLIFALSIIGLAISLPTGSSIPFWLMLGFSTIFSVERWFSHITRKNRIVGKLYRLTLNLSILSILGLIIWSGTRLFSQQFTHSPLIGSLIFLAEFTFFIWMWRVISKNSWRWPSMKLTVFSLISLFLIFSFAGVPPMSTYKADLIERWKVTTTFQPEQPITTPEAPPKITPAKPPEPIPAKPPTLVVSSYTYKEVTSLVYTKINSERAKQGLPQLRTDTLLTSLAEEHSESMVLNGFLGHERSPGERSFGYNQQPGTTRGENLSKTPQRRVIPGPYLTLEEVTDWIVSGWMSSTGHRSNILEPKFTKTGIGVSLLGEYLYITQIFEGETTTSSGPTTSILEVGKVEQEAFNLINQEREKIGLIPTIWDNKLYSLSKAHTEEMASKGELFHTPLGASYAENAWGAPWGGISKQNLARTMVSNWMSSPLHRAWILHIPLKTSVVSIVDDSRGQYASWTFYFTGDGGPPLIQKAYNMWMSETGGRVPWLDWLDSKGYPYNTSWLVP